MASHTIGRRFHACAFTWLLLAASAHGALAQAAAVAADPGADPAAAPPPANAAAAPAPAADDSYFSEPHVIRKSVDWGVALFGDSNGGADKSGFYPEFSNMHTGAGWLSIGPGYRQYLFDRRLFVDGSAAVSWHLYKMVQGTIEAPSLAGDRVTVGVQGMWQDQTQVNYFGTGSDSRESDRSQYQIKTTDVVGYATLRAKEWLSVDGAFGWLRQPTLEPADGSFRPDLPSTLILFAEEPGVTGSQPDYLYSTVAVTADTRDYKNHPTSGGLYRVALTSYSDQDHRDFDFTEYQAEALQLVPVIGRRWVLAFRGWMVLTGVPDGHEVPIYLQPSIGGNNTLRSYRSYRFHDLNSLAANAESRWALFDHVDLAAFFDAGNVAGRASDLNLEKTSYGVGLRLHTVRTTLARVDVANGAEGWRVLFRTTEPLRLGRVSRRIANVPFAP
jgi:hypothetical protein